MGIISDCTIIGRLNDDGPPPFIGGEGAIKGWALIPVELFEVMGGHDCEAVRNYCARLPKISSDEIKASQDKEAERQRLYALGVSFDDPDE